MNKSTQCLKMEIESVKETQIEGNLEMKNWGSWTRDSEASLSNRIQEVEEKTSGIEDKMEEIETSQKVLNPPLSQIQA